MRKVISLAVIVLIALFFWRVIPPWMDYFDFQDEVREAARYSEGQTADEVKAHILKLAQESHVPLDADSVKILKEERLVHVSLAYTRNLEILPTYYYPYQFTIEVDTEISPIPPLKQR